MMTKLKKLLVPIGIYLGTFIVLNVGIFFLLKMTQPKSAVLDGTLHGDSTAISAEDSALAIEEAEFDHALEAAEQAVSQATNSEHQGESGQHSSDSSDSTQDEIEAHASSELGADTSLTEVSETEVSGEDSSASAETEVNVSESPSSTAEISKLAKLLEGMKPDEAAVIAERLPTDTIVDLVMRMKSRNGAKMMASLPVPVAASVATRMAELSGAKKPS